MHTVLTSANYDKLDELLELAHDIGCGSFAVGDLIPESETSKRLILQDAQRAELHSYVLRAIHRAQQLGLSENLSAFLADNGGHGEKKTADLGLFGSPCLEPWTSVTVLADGKAGPCCVFWDARAPNIRDARLKDIWEGTFLRETRRGILQGRFPTYCAHCNAGLRARTELLRRKLHWTQMSRPRQVACLIRKAVSSTRRFGLRRAVRRGREWLNTIKR